MTILKPQTKAKLKRNRAYKLMIKLHGLEAVKQTLRRKDNGNNRKKG